jgi:hypothetical protein
VGLIKTRRRRFNVFLPFDRGPLGINIQPNLTTPAMLLRNQYPPSTAAKFFGCAFGATL